MFRFFSFCYCGQTCYLAHKHNHLHFATAVNVLSNHMSNYLFHSAAFTLHYALKIYYVFGMRKYAEDLSVAVFRAASSADAFE